MKIIRKRIGLVIADKNEIHEYDGFKFIKNVSSNLFVNLYQYKDLDIYVIYSRIGLVNSAIATQFLIDHFNVEQIWNYGAVGSTGKHNLYDVVVPDRFYFYDVITPWYKRGQTPGEKECYFNAYNNCDDANIASGNSFIDSRSYVKKLNKELKIHLIDMESCAIAQTCDRNDIPFYCVKGVSDIIGKSIVDKDKINESINKASKLAFERMFEMIDEVNG